MLNGRPDETSTIGAKEKPRRNDLNPPADFHSLGAENTPLVTLADLATVWVQADVFERDLHSIAAGEKADVTTTAYPDDHFSAEVARVGAGGVGGVLVHHDPHGQGVEPRTP